MIGGKATNTPTRGGEQTNHYITDVVTELDISVLRKPKGNREWTIKRNWQHCVHNRQDKDKKKKKKNTTQKASKMYNKKMLDITICRTK